MSESRMKELLVQVGADRIDFYELYDEYGDYEHFCVGCGAVGMSGVQHKEDCPAVELVRLINVQNQ